MIFQYLNKKSQGISISLMALLVLELIPNPQLFALTGGPSQPEVQSFEPVGTSEMVDVSTGDFNYNIPVMDIGGYPINLSYHSGIGVDDEASWVGLGWNLNPGVINRNMRGVPDDFSGDNIVNKYHKKQEVDLNASLKVGDWEIFGLKKSQKFDKFGVSLNFKYNNYRGMGFSFGVSPLNAQYKNLKFETNIQIGSKDGLSVSPNLKATIPGQEKERNGVAGGKLNIGSSINSRQGLQSLSFGVSFNGITQKKTGNRGAFDASSVYSFSTPSYTPSAGHDERSHGYSAHFSLGPEFVGAQPQMTIKGGVNFSKSYQINNEKPSYGVYYEQDQIGDDAMMEINRENDGAYSANTKFLPVSSHTFDIFAASAQGVGGSYRIKRGDAGVLHDPVNKQSGYTASAGMDVGAGALSKSGYDVGASYIRNRSQPWQTNQSAFKHFGVLSHNELDGKWTSQNRESNEPLYEPAYFKSSSEPAFLSSFDYSIFDTSMVTPKIEYNLIGFMNRYVDTKKPFAKTMKSAEIRKIKRTGRDKRNSNLSVLTENQTSHYGLNKKIKSYIPVQGNTNGDLIAEVIGYANSDKHFGEITIVQPGGMRYVYGIPAKNLYQKDATFNVSGRNVNQSTGQVEYGIGDNSEINDRGKDNLFQSTEMPAYAHSFLLTGYLSEDYVDISGDGISDDDLGTAVKFNYQRVHDAYEWRVPFKENHASLNENQKSNQIDNYGNYSYGQKEIWLTHSIETKTQIAIFRISKRNDGYGVKGEDGGLGVDQTSFKLDKITLYSKQDFEKNGLSAEPIKTVHFEYSYELCPGIENSINNGGKLTLKKLYFTYGKSQKGKTGSYEFNYGYNPSYNLKASDCWGTYKPNNVSSTEIANAEFPYTTQNKANADLYAGSWCISEIMLPSGGSIKLEYEADDYAYVMDKKAMRMFKIAGFSNSNNPGEAPTNFLYRGFAKQNDNMHVDLEQPITGPDADAIFRKRYLEGIKDLQFTVLADINGQDQYEYVKGYCEIDISKSHVINNGNSAYIRLKKVRTGDDGKNGKEVNPVTLASMNYARMNCDHLVNPSPRTIGDQPGGATTNKQKKRQFFGLAAWGREVVKLIGGQYYNMHQRGFCKTVNTNKSWVRLNVPYGTKYGGGHRVKKIFVSDKWGDIGSSNSSATDSEYGTEYIYQTANPENPEEIISSGVASYETSMGGDENPWREPIAMKQELKLAPDIGYFIEGPVGESLFPGASIVYSKIKTRAISNASIERTGTGYTINEFYTAKDFPVLVDHSELIREEKKSLLNFVKSYNHATVAQGHYIEVNDMHGKPKKTADYDEYGQQVGGVEYVYQWGKNAAGYNQLFNDVKVVNRQGQILNKTLGVEVDMVNDAIENITSSKSFGLALNLDIAAAGFIPLPFGSIWPSYSTFRANFFRVTTTKFVKRYGILVETKAFKAGSNISTKNLLYDEETGDVLLTSVQNEFDDNTYSFTTPAHWAYDKGMGQAYKNTGMKVKGILLSYDQINFPNSLNPENYLVEGDEVVLQHSLNNLGIWKDNDWLDGTYHVYRGHGGNLNLMDKDGKPPVEYYGTPLNLLVLRSGRRNKASSPIAQTTMLTNPMSTNTLAFNEVIDASAIEYKDHWQTHMTYFPKTTCEISDFGQELIQLLDCAKDSVGYNQLSITIKNETDSLRWFSNDSWNAVPVIMNQALIFKNSEVSYNFQYHVKNYSNWRNMEKVKIPSTQISYLSVAKSNKSTKFFTNNICNSSCNFNFSTSRLKAILDSNYLNTTGSNFSGSYCDALYTNPNYSNNGFSIYFIEQLPGNVDFCTFKYDVPSDVFIHKILNVNYSRVGNDKQSIIANINYLDMDGNTKSTDITIKSCQWSDDLITCITTCYSATKQYAVNPYLKGIKGNWRPFRNYKYLDTRTYQSTSPDTRKDGKFNTFTPFWSSTGPTTPMQKTTNPKWVWASEITKYSPFGQELETKDALNRYTAELYGYFHTLPIAAAGNARYNQIAFDGFEDYGYLGNKMNAYMSCEAQHFQFETFPTESEIDGSVSHSGWHSIKILPGKNAEATRPVILPQNWNNTIDTNETYKLKQSDDLGIFSPSPGEYLVSAWVKEDRSGSISNYSQAKIQVTFYLQGGGNSAIYVNPSGLLIEGWQRIMGKFTVPANTQTISVKLIGASDANTWFDDIRIHPNAATMKTFAYDHRTLRNMAAMDENNYATFYEYDAEGSLIRVKKETTKGIITIQENRTHNRKK